MRIVRQTEESDQLLQDLVEAKQAEAAAHARVMACEGALLNYMEAHREKTLVLNAEDRQFTATYTQRTSTTINEQGLRKALRARVFDKYTKRVLDKKALEQAMSAGDVDPMLVAKYVTAVPGARYLTFREKELDEAQGV